MPPPPKRPKFSNQTPFINIQMVPPTPESTESSRMSSSNIEIPSPSSALMVPNSMSFPRIQMPSVCSVSTVSNSMSSFNMQMTPQLPLQTSFSNMGMESQWQRGMVHNPMSFSNMGMTSQWQSVMVHNPMPFIMNTASHRPTSWSPSPGLSSNVGMPFPATGSLSYYPMQFSNMHMTSQRPPWWSASQGSTFNMEMPSTLSRSGPPYPMQFSNTHMTSQRPAWWSASQGPSFNMEMTSTLPRSGPPYSMPLSNTHMAPQLPLGSSYSSVTLLNVEMSSTSPVSRSSPPVSSLNMDVENQFPPLWSTAPGSSSSQNVNKNWDFSRLPNGILQKIFLNLRQDDLFRIRRVCKAWKEVAEWDVFWRRVDMKDMNLTFSKGMLFIEQLKSIVTHLRLHIKRPDYRMHTYRNRYCLSFFLNIQCPNLEVLIIRDCSFQYEFEEMFINERMLLAKLRVLSLECIHLALTRQITREFHYCLHKGNIRVLDLSRMDNCHGNIVFDVSQFINLKELRLSRYCLRSFPIYEFPNVIQRLEILDLQHSDSHWHSPNFFSSIKRNAVSLKKLYLCFSKIQDIDLHFEADEVDCFPQLQVICLRNNWRLGPSGVVELLIAAPSLTRVDVSCANLTAVWNDPPENLLNKVHYYNAFDNCGVHLNVDFYNC